MQCERLDKWREFSTLYFALYSCEEFVGQCNGGKGR